MKIIERIIVSKLEKTQRLNTFCELNVNFFESRKSVKKALKKGSVLLNNQVQHGGVWLKNGDEITILDLEDTPPKTYKLSIPIIYEDDEIAIVNKPAGLITSGNQFKTLLNTLQYNLQKSDLKNALPWPLPTHRLDSQTSGLVLIAKTKTARIKIGNMFENNTIKKTYFAIAMGQLSKKAKIKGYFDGQINNKIAWSDFEIISETRSLKNDWLTLIKLMPKTGRTHQLRIHLSEEGTPILGDKIYSEKTIKQKGLFLAAVGLKFKHPINEQELNISIPLPSKFKKRLDLEETRWEKFN